jgi:hypothetical protein
MKRTTGIHQQVAVRNIESSMRVEGFRVSRETKVACSEILRSGQNARELASYHVNRVLQKAK